MVALTNGSTSKLEGTKVTLYTNHYCPWAHRAHIALRELGIPYEEVIIDLKKPREPWYLEVNPRGLVPSIKFSGGAVKDQILTESSVVSRFLADAYPSHLVPVSDANDGKGALSRARADFFVDTWFTKVNSKLYGALGAEGEDKERAGSEIVDAVAKEIEPLLSDAKPFFGGSERLTIAEVLTASFILRLFSYTKDAELMPPSVEQGLNNLPNFSKWAAALHKEDSVTYIYDHQGNVDGAKTRFAKAKAAAK